MDHIYRALPPQFTAHVQTAAQRGVLSHAIILTGQGDLTAGAKYIAMAMECEGAEPPCGACLPCRKTAGDIHPDVTFVRDEAHKNLSMDVIRALRADAFLLPNEGQRKVYIFPDCSLLEPKVQNLLLKVLEEGPSRAAFLFCAANSSVLLPTIRSRCILLHLEGEEAAAKLSPQAEELLQLLARRDKTGVAVCLLRLEQSKLKREELQALTGQVRDALAHALAAYYRGQRPGLTALGPKRMMALCDVLGRTQRQLRSNLNVGQTCGGLSVELTALL